jgi:pyruvate formate lyase activating enzyme
VVANVGGTIGHTIGWQFSSVGFSPIERRPLFHFTPGEPYLAVGFFGCSFGCYFCQNHHISQELKGERTECDLLELLVNGRSNLLCYDGPRPLAGVSFTYNEPTLYFTEIASFGGITRELGYKVVVKTNGFVHRNALKSLSQSVDAYNVDIKGGSHDYLEAGGRKETVLRAIDAMLELGHHVEVSYFVHPRNLKNRALHKQTAKWLAKRNWHIPVHILYAYPCHRLAESYPQNDLISVYNLFREELGFVYISNVYTEAFAPYRNTHCPACGKLLISRQGRVEILATSCCIPIIKE